MVTGDLGPNHLLRRATPSGVYLEGNRVIDAERVVHVALNPDDELRNLQVALLYSLTSARLAQRIEHLRPRRADERPNANWFTIAQWAVLTVGRNMRTSAMPHRASALPETIRRFLTPSILNLRSADDRRVAAALSYGQVMVFASMYRALLDSPFADTKPMPTAECEPELDLDGPPPAAAMPTTDGGPEVLEPEPPVNVQLAAKVAQRLVEEAAEAEALERQQAEEDRKADLAQRDVALALAEQLGAEVGELRTTATTVERAEFYDQLLSAIAREAGYEPELREAFHLYERAAGIAPPPDGADAAERRRSRADLIFEANLRITAIEQVILDKAVTMVVDHLPRHLTEQAEGRMATFAERSLRVPRLIAQVNASKRLSIVADLAKDMWARVMTDQIMVIALPTETIRLGRDIPSRDWREPFYAPELLELSPSARHLFDQFDRSLGDGRGAGAGDWRRFDDRLNFAANLIRSRQQDPTLFWQPYTEEDVARVWDGQYPARIADPFEQAVRVPSFPIDMDGGTLNTNSCAEVAGKAPNANGGRPR